jgi:hypothetical protein
MKDGLKIGIDGHLFIKNETHNEVMLDQHNAIHPQNMSRIIARALANEPNSIIGRMAFGNGGTFVDVGSNVVFNLPNIGEVSGWESRLYNETYSEIVNETDADWKLDLGSAGPGVVRTGGGSNISGDPVEGGGVTSQEVGTKSNVIVSAFLNAGEPSGQNESIISPDGDTFIFDEIGLFSPGKQAANSPGYTSIDVGNKLSLNISPINDTYYGGEIRLNVTTTDPDNPEALVTLDATYTVPIGGGTGTNGEITYGDVCQGINGTGINAWTYTGQGADISRALILYITDNSGGLYNTMEQMESYGFLTFMSRVPGEASSVTINECSATLTGSAHQLPYVLSSGDCNAVNVNNVDGDSLGSSNDAGSPENERERLLTHIIFTPIPKATDISISITYTLTVSVLATSDTVVSII